MSAINAVAIVGRLTRDPELKTTAGGQSVCSLRVAVDGAGQKEGDEYKAGFFDVTVWGKQAEACAAYLTKGSQVGVSGQLRFREWVSDDGGKRSAVEINAQQVQFLTPKGEDGATPKAQPTVDEPAREEDDIPF